MGCVNTKPLGASKKAKPQSTTDAKAATAATAASTSKVLTLLAANHGDDKDAKPTSNNVLMLVPAISNIAKPTNETALTAIDTKVLFEFIYSAFRFENFPNVMIDLILKYALFNQFVYDITVAPTPHLSTLSLFSHVDGTAFSNAVVLAEQVAFAAPLKQIETQVRANPRILLTTFRINYQLAGMLEPLVIQGTPEQIAIILLDINLQSQGAKPVFDRGLSSLLRILRKELLPDTLSLAAKQVVIAAPALDNNAEKAMDTEQRPILEQAFDFIKANNTEAAVKAVRDYIKNIKPQVITNYIYFLKLLRLVGNAFIVLVNREDELNDRWYGAQGEQYCFKVIGLAIEMEFGERMRRQLENGMGNFLHYDRVAPRLIFNAAKKNSSFLQNQHGSLILGHSFFYDLFGQRFTAMVPEPPRMLSLFLLCSNYISSAGFLRHTTALNLCNTPPSTSTPKLAGP